MSSIFRGLKDAQVFDQGVFLSPGIYDLEVSKCLLKATRKSGDALIVEFKVLSSTSPDHAVGSKATWFQKLSDKGVAFGAMKHFMAACAGLDIFRDKETIARDLDPSIEQHMEDAVDEKKQLLAGTRVHVEVRHKDTLKGGVFSYHDWAPIAAAA